jgi:hypothetical protein
MTLDFRQFRDPQAASVTTFVIRITQRHRIANGAEEAFHPVSQILVNGLIGDWPREPSGDE